MPYPYDTSNIYNTIIEVFDMYNIREKILSITFDNVAISFSKPLYKHHVVIKNFHKKCSCHIINLCVQDVVEQF